MEVMSNSVRISCLFLLMSFMSFAQAEFKVLTTVSSDIDKEVSKIVYEVEDGRSLKALYNEVYLNNVLVERTQLDISAINGNGVVLHRKDNYVTVRLYSHNFDEERGGVLYLDTLNNGITGKRKEYEIVTYIDGGNAEMFNNKKKFNNMKFVAKKSGVFGVIGIERVEFTNK